VHSAVIAIQINKPEEFLELTCGYQTLSPRAKKHAGGTDFQNKHDSWIFKAERFARGVAMVGEWDLLMFVIYLMNWAIRIMLCLPLRHLAV
jgi:hypothetical protein